MSIEEKRKQALLFAGHATKLASAKIFPQVLAAVQSKDYAKFEASCTSIGISTDDAAQIWKIVKKESKVISRMPAGASCW